MSKFVYKICLIGDGGVGKTSLLIRYMTNKFDLDTKMTIGVDMMKKKVSIDSNEIIFSIWDLGGQEKYEMLFETFIEGTDGVLLCFDLTSYRTFINLNKWTSLIRNKSRNPIIVLLGTKSDLVEQISVDSEEVKSFVEEFLISRYFETSALNGANIETVFLHLADILLHGGSN